MINTGGQALPSFEMCFDNGTKYTDDHFELRRNQIPSAGFATCTCMVQQLADTEINITVNLFTCENGDECPWKLQIYKDGCEVFSECCKSSGWVTKSLPFSAQGSTFTFNYIRLATYTTEFEVQIIVEADGE